MPRTRSQEIMLRDEQISVEAGEGVLSRRDLARKYGISEARVSQIILAKSEEIGDDSLRAELVSKLENVIQKQMEVFARPRPVKVTPSGKLIYEPLLDENGEPIRNAKGQVCDDYTKPVYDDSPRTEAAKMLPSLMERLSKFRALDRPKPKEKSEAPELQKYMEWAQDNMTRLKEKEAELEELKSRLGLPGEIFEADVVTPESGTE